MDQREDFYRGKQTSAAQFYEMRPSNAVPLSLPPIVHKPTNEQRIVAALERLVEIGETLLLRDTFRSTSPPKGKR